MEAAYIRNKGQLTIPAKLRKRHDIKPGIKVCFIKRGGEILFQPITKAYIRTVFGMLESKASVTKELLEERARDRKREQTKLGNALAQ